MVDYITVYQNLFPLWSSFCLYYFSLYLEMVPWYFLTTHYVLTELIKYPRLIFCKPDARFLDKLSDARVKQKVKFLIKYKIIEH